MQIQLHNYIDKTENQITDNHGQQDTSEHNTSLTALTHEIASYYPGGDPVSMLS